MHATGDSITLALLVGRAGGNLGGVRVHSNGGDAFDIRDIQHVGFKARLVDRQILMEGEQNGGDDTRHAMLQAGLGSFTIVGLRFGRHTDRRSDTANSRRAGVAAFKLRRFTRTEKSVHYCVRNGLGTAIAKLIDAAA